MVLHDWMTVHWRSLCVPAATDSKWMVAHTVCDRHVRSDVAVGAVVSYSSPKHAVLSWHSRSCVALPSRVWCCEVVHVVCASHALLFRKNAPEHDAHLASPLVGQVVPVAPVPLSHVHCLSAPHTASAVFEAGVAITLPCASQSTTWAEHALSSLALE